MTKKPPKKVRRKNDPSATVYELKIPLLEIEPPIWRRIEVSAAARLCQRHTIFQSVMGWRGEHFHEFIISVGETISLDELNPGAEDGS